MKLILKIILVILKIFFNILYIYMNYKQKYLKYKIKYLTVKKLYGGADFSFDEYLIQQQKKKLEHKLKFLELPINSNSWQERKLILSFTSKPINVEHIISTVNISYASS